MSPPCYEKIYAQADIEMHRQPEYIMLWPIEGIGSKKNYH